MGTVEKSEESIKRIIFTDTAHSKLCDCCKEKSHANIGIHGVWFCLCREHIKQIVDVCNVAVNREWWEQEE